MSRFPLSFITFLRGTRLLTLSRMNVYQLVINCGMNQTCCADKTDHNYYCIRRRWIGYAVTRIFEIYMLNVGVEENNDIFCRLQFIIM